MARNFTCPKCGTVDGMSPSRPHPVDGLPRLRCPACEHIWAAPADFADAVAKINDEEQGRPKDSFAEKVDEVHDLLHKTPPARTCPKCQHDGVGSLFGSGYGGGREYVCNRCRSHWTERAEHNVKAEHEAAVKALAREIYLRHVTTYAPESYIEMPLDDSALWSMGAAEDFFKGVESYAAGTRLSDPKPNTIEDPTDVTLRKSVEITVFRDGKILAVSSRNFDGFCGVGGKVEPGETYEEAARRELMEETGCRAESIEFIAGQTLDAIPGDDVKTEWYCAGFVADIGTQEPRQNEVGTVPYWTTREDMVANSLFPEWYAWWFGVLDMKAAKEAQ